jgi:hypothetical protein
MATTTAAASRNAENLDMGAVDAAARCLPMPVGNESPGGIVNS